MIFRFLVLLGIFYLFTMEMIYSHSQKENKTQCSLLRERRLSGGCRSTVSITGVSVRKWDPKAKSMGDRGWRSFPTFQQSQSKIHKYKIDYLYL